MSSSADVRRELVDALRLDLVGPSLGLGNPEEILAEPPSVFYRTGFLVPIEADEDQKVDESCTEEVDGTPQNAEVSKVLFDFTDPSAVRAWSAVDDRVMGGVSRSHLWHDRAGHAVFEGEVWLAQNGGFASVRCSPGDRGHAGAQACLIEVRGDNKQFKLSLLTDDGFDSLNYQASFAPTGTDWQTLHPPLADFRASFRGREVTNAPALDPARIRQVGLMIAARQAGPFELHIRRISLA